MNKPTGTVNIRGREYETVALRVKKFRDAHPEFALQTEIISVNEEAVIMRAAIMDASGRCVATGHAEEHRAASQINRTSALENAETSAIGRALATFGLGGTEFATANEVQNAIHQQEKERETDPRRQTLIADLESVKTLDDFKTTWQAFTPEERELVGKADFTRIKADLAKAELV